MLHEYHLKEVRAHAGAELGTRISLADQLTLILDPLYFKIRAM